MPEKIVLGRIQHKHDTEVNWEKAVNFVPRTGELIVYDRDENYSKQRLKIGDGTTNVNLLSFVGIGQQTLSGGEIFGDYENNRANEHAVAFGAHTAATGKASLTQGSTIFKSGSEYIINSNGLVYVISADCDLAASEGDGNYEVITQESLETLVGYSCIETSSGGFVPASDLRLSEAIGTASTAGGMGAVAYSRASKSLGYRTQTGYPPSEEYVNSRPETFMMSLAHTFIDVDEVNILESKYGSISYEALPNQVSPLLTVEFTSNFDMTISISGASEGTYIDITGYADDVSEKVEQRLEITSELVGRETFVELSNIKILSIQQDSHTNVKIKYDAPYPAENVGQAAVAIGSDTAATANNSFAGGYKSQALGSQSFAFGGTAGENNKITQATGQASIAIGSGVVASGAHSFASGVLTTAKGSAAHVEGHESTASGNYAHAEGYKTSATGDYSHSQGYSTVASANGAHSEGYLAQATSIRAHAEGYLTISCGEAAHAEGSMTNASGDASHSEGKGTSSSGKYSHAEGSGTQATSTAAHAEGWKTQAKGLYSHAEGNMTIAQGNYSHAEGESTQATVHYAHAEGYKSIARGQASHAEGRETVASGKDSHVHGRYNMLDVKRDSEGNMLDSNGDITTDVLLAQAANTYAHIVGNGTSASTRSNAYTLDWLGNAWFAGNITVGADNKQIRATHLETYDPTDSSIDDFGDNGDIYIMYN